MSTETQLTLHNNDSLIHIVEFDRINDGIDGRAGLLVAANDNISTINMALPLPADLVFLSDLDSLADEKKVRFLGCVRQYNPKLGYLYMAHEHPKLPYQIIARVNIDHVLESARNEHLQTGAWLNIVGYTCGRTLDPQYTFHTETKVYSEVTIRAIMLWNADSPDLGVYVKALEARKKTGTAG